MKGCCHLRYPIFEALGQSAGFSTNWAFVQAFWRVVKPLGSCLGNPLSPRKYWLAYQKAFWLFQGRGEARPVGFAGMPRRGDRERGGELQGLAVSHLNGTETGLEAPSTLETVPRLPSCCSSWG